VVAAARSGILLTDMFDFTQWDGKSHGMPGEHAHRKATEAGQRIAPR
jgi:hypothetical protein